MKFLLKITLNEHHGQTDPWQGAGERAHAVTVCGVRGLIPDDDMMISTSFWLVTGDRCGVITSHITGIIAHSDGHHTCIGVKYLVIYVCLLNKYTVYIVSLATINTHLTKVHSSFTSFRAVEQPLLACTIFANNNKKSWFNYCQAQAQFSFLSTLFNNASPQ